MAAVLDVISITIFIKKSSFWSAEALGPGAVGTGGVTDEALGMVRADTTRVSPSVKTAQH